MLNQPVFNEEDIKKMFKSSELENSDLIRVEFKPEIPKKDPIVKKPEDPIFKPSSQSFFQSPEHAPTNTAVRTKTHFKIFSYIVKNIIKYLGLFLLIFIISYTVINSGALILKMKYFWETEYHNQNWTEKYPISEPNLATENHLIIPKINVNAPIAWNVNPDNITTSLESGVAHYAGTAIPGSLGNIFITGHSSYYIWAPGTYKDVFALLNNLDVGDKIYIQYGGATFTYEVTGQQVVRPNDISVLGQGNSKILSLMTCVPIGTNLQRLIVVAKQIQ